MHLGDVIFSFLSTLTQLVTIKSRKISFKKITFDERNSKQTTMTGRLRESPENEMLKKKDSSYFHHFLDDFKLVPIA